MSSSIRQCVIAILVALALLQGQRYPAGQERRRDPPIAATDRPALRDTDRRIDRLLEAGALRVRQVRDDALVSGRTHERLDQFYKGVRVFGGGVTRQLDDRLTVSVFGTIYSGMTLDPAPILSPDDARAAIGRIAGAGLGPDRAPELVVLPRDDGTFALTYRAQVFAGGALTMYFIDARDGRVVWQYDNLQTQSAVGSGVGVLGDTKKISTTLLAGNYLADDQLRPPSLKTYDLRGELTRTINFLNGVVSLAPSDLASDSDNSWTDGANVDAHVYEGWTYDYYFKRFGRRGLDNNNIRILGITHTVRRSDLLTYPPNIIGIFFVNAFYAGDGVMVYGEGLPPGFVLAATRQRVDFLAGGLDVVSHELTHGVTEFSSNLVYQNESGALNEAFSDIMGTSVEFFYQPVRNRGGNYLIGEDVFVPGGIRSLADPGAFGDPDHYSKRFVGASDNGGVHTNSLIAGHAFYLAVEGGANRTSGLSVQGVGAANREQMEKVFYRAFAFLMPANATFSVARAATIQAAQDLYGAGSAPERAVTQAWTAVGVN